MSDARPKVTKGADWEDVRASFAFTPEEEAEMEKGKRALRAEVRAHRLVDIRKRQHVTQVHLAKLIGVTQGRISQIEKGDLERAEVETLAAYVSALGGRLKLVADFGDESLVLG